MHLMKTKNGEMNMYNMEKQHKLGKLHALERICLLLDEDSFREIGSNITNLEDAFNIKKGQFPYDGVITGCLLYTSRCV